MPPEESGGASGTPDLGAMVGRLMVDPALLGRIAEAVGLDGAPAGEEKRPPEPDGAEPKKPDPAVACGHRTALLRALRPFFGEHRRTTIDRLIALSQLSGSLAGGAGDGGGQGR